MGFGDLFKPKYKHSSSKVRMEAVKKLDDQNKLYYVAKNDFVIPIRVEAVKRITDESLLEDIAISEYKEKSFKYDATTSEAVNKINDESRLENISLNAYYLNVKEAAICKINNESILANIAINTRHESTRILAVNKISDEKLLAEVVKNYKPEYYTDYHSKLKIPQGILKALNKIQDETILIDILYNMGKGEDSNHEYQISKIRRNVIQEINDVTVLSYIVKNDSDAQVRQEASRKINDESQLVDLAMNGSKEVVSKIRDESKLINIAKNAQDVQVREEAMKNPNLKNQELLIEMLKCDEYGSSAKEHAIAKINDESVLIDYAKNSSWGNVRCKAVEKITDESVLIDIAENDSDYRVRKTAVNNTHLTNRATLVKIAKNDPSHERVEERNSEDHSTYYIEYPVRRAASNRLGGQYGEYCWKRDD